jgi:hypothetical protein
MTSIFYSQKQPHRLSAIKTEEDVVIPSAVDETSFPLLWTDLDPDDKELPSVHVIFLEESMSAWPDQLLEPASLRAEFSPFPFFRLGSLEGIRSLVQLSIKPFAL